jgi:replicative DNA helicase
MYFDKIEELKKKTPGKLIIKEYPTASVSAAHFRHLINELKLKKNFKPDIVYVDYLNICSSSRMRGQAVNTYSYVKAIAEELRGLAVEKNFPIISATQLTRTGFSSSDPGLEDTSESFALPATVDFMVALVSSEQLEELNQIQVKQLKNRYNDPTKNRKFVVGVDRSRMKLYNTDAASQTLIDQKMEEDDKPAFDKGPIGQRLSIERTSKKDFSSLFKE